MVVDVEPRGWTLRAHEAPSQSTKYQTAVDCGRLRAQIVVSADVSAGLQEISLGFREVLEEVGHCCTFTEVITDRGTLGAAFRGVRPRTGPECVEGRAGHRRDG